MSWREKFVIHLGASFFSGITLGDWLGVLRENRFAVAPSCLPRAAIITYFSLQNSPIAWLERARYRHRWEKIAIPPPLFVLGHYRSGTTHLHNLLAVDPRFACLNAYQATYPDTFLLTERIGSKLLANFLPRTRPFDNVRLGFDVPYEDESAMTAATRLTSYVTGVFPKRQSHYDRFLTLQNATPDEVSRWRVGLMRLMQKLTLKYGKPLILKSPPHTCRIRLLLEMFPHAKFVHIHREPYVVIQSTVHMMESAVDWLRLQDTTNMDWTERALRQWREMYDQYFAQRELIPAGNLHEIAFPDLERDPVGELRRMYDALGLPPFDEVEPGIAQYLESVAGYKKNRFTELSPELKARIAETCRRGFEEWGYQR